MSKKRIIQLISLVICLVICVAFVLNFDRIFPDESHGDGGSASDIEKDRLTVYIDGEKYLRRTDVETFLIMGLDRVGDIYTDGRAQADALLLVVFDKSQSTYRMIQINRDTMTEVDRYNNRGEYVDTQTMQIALSYAYGELNSIISMKKCRNTSKAVSGLLYGIKIDHYLCITMDGLSKLVDHVGGVEITIEEDLTEIDERFEAGARVLMDGELALEFVRARSSLSDSSNIARMERQRVFLGALIERMGDDSMEEFDLIEAYAKVEDNSLTGCDEVCMDVISEYISDFDSLGVSALPGEAVMGEKYMEFYVNEEELKGFIKDVFLEDYE